MELQLLLTLAFATITSPAFGGGSIPPSVSRNKAAVFTNLFNQADADGDGILDTGEFSNSYGASERPVVTEIRFDRLAKFITIEDRLIKVARFGILPEDFIRSNGGRKIVPSKSEIFLAADNNRDGFLSLTEFFATRIRSASTEASGTKAFEKLDKNDDNRVSPAEFGIEIKRD